MRNSKLRTTQNMIRSGCGAARADNAQIMKRHTFHMRAFYENPKYEIINDATHIKLGGNKDERAKFAERHYIQGANEFFALTGNLLASLAYGYHGVPKSLLRHIKIPERPELAGEVREMVSAYGTMREATRVYTIDEMRASFHNVTSRLDEFLMRAYDTASRLQLSREMTMLRVIENADKGIETAHKAMEFYYPYLDLFGNHALSMLLSDAAFSVLEPERYDAISRRLYGKNEQEGKEALSGLANQVRMRLKQLLGEFNAFYGTDEDFDDGVRVKTIYSINGKFKKYDLDAVKDIEQLEFMNDIIAGMIISCDKSWSVIYALTDYLRNYADGVKLAKPELILGGKGNYKDYKLCPKPENPIYESVHIILDLEYLLRMQIPSGIRHLELQLRTRKAHEMAESSAIINHASYKSKRSGIPLHDAMIKKLDVVHETASITRRIGIRVIDPNHDLSRIRQPQLRLDTFTKPRLQERMRIKLMVKYPGFGVADFIIPEQSMEEIYRAEKGSVINVFVSTDDPNRRLWIKQIEVIPIK